MKTNIYSAFVILMFLSIQSVSLRAQSFTAVPQPFTTSLSEAELAKIHSDNYKKGLDPFTGLSSQFIFKTNEIKYKNIDTEKIIQEIKSLSGVTECVFIQEKLEVSITCAKQKDNPLYAKFKEILAQHEIRMMSSTEMVFKTN